MKDANGLALHVGDRAGACEVNTCAHCGGDALSSEHFVYKGRSMSCLNERDSRRYESMPEVTAQDVRDVIDAARCTRCGEYGCDYCRSV